MKYEYILRELQKLGQLNDNEIETLFGNISRWLEERSEVKSEIFEIGNHTISVCTRNGLLEIKNNPVLGVKHGESQGEDSRFSVLVKIL